MKIKLFLLASLLLVIIGCASVSQTKNMSDADYRKLYYDYRALVTKAIKNKNEPSIRQITDEYISKTGNKIFLIGVYQLDSSEKWDVLLYKTNPNEQFILPAIHYAQSDKVNIYRGKGYVLLQSNEIRSSTYKDNICIKMAIKI
jgi:hypothetical protein